MASVLLVEDERFIRWAFRKVLERRGHSVREAATLAEARSRIEEDLPDVLVLDLRLPDGDGIDFAVRRDGASAASAFIVVTASASDEAAARARTGGATGFFAKPVDAGVLVDAVERAAASRPGPTLS